MIIVPAILTNDPKDLEHKIRAVEGVLPRVHLDVIDGIFADNRTVALETVQGVETNLSFDIHLMVREPVDWVDRAVGVGERVIGQIEMMLSQEDFVRSVQEAGLEAGLAVDISTPVEELDEKVLPKLDIVLVMSVSAGRGGQEFNPISLEKIKELAALRKKEGYTFEIYVDGGVGGDNIEKIAQAGANTAAVGSRLFEGDVKENMEELNKAIGKQLKVQN